MNKQEREARAWVERMTGEAPSNIVSINHLALGHVVNALRIVDQMREALEAEADNLDRVAACLRREVEAGECFRQSACCKMARSEIAESAAGKLRRCAVAQEMGGG